ncbi:hypothetical protein NDU88_001556 [Pleurodeles waltl]|uniref:GAGE domain-containing protein n=1 Tax=Pleurodeles waltl TaxID=8319 RepID=A0AAV7KSZ2_PLEWA|nr:hypothetical protein NDU88_001556 [Pleurodeles waltl]
MKMPIPEAPVVRERQPEQVCRAVGDQAEPELALDQVSQIQNQTPEKERVLEESEWKIGPEDKNEEK